MPRPAGKSTYEMAKRRRRIGNFVVFVIVVVGIGLIYLALNPQAYGIGGVGVLALIVIVRILVDFGGSYDKRSRRSEKRAERGAEAEEEIGDLLDKLDDGFEVIHDVTSPHGNIDHIVISKNNGLFLIETKSHHGRVGFEGDDLLINGDEPEKNFIAQTLKNTYWLKEKVSEALGLNIWITPVLVFTNAFVPYHKPIKGVIVTNKKFLLGAIQKPHNVNPVNLKLWVSKEKLIDEIS
jgi:hypothetical protein